MDGEAGDAQKDKVLLCDPVHGVDYSSVLSWSLLPSPPQLKLPKDISCYQAVTGSETQT